MTTQVLIIEDEAALAKALAVVCERIGAWATLCASGKAGLRELSPGKFNLVILDLGLPDINGLQVLKEINLVDQCPPVLIITAHSTLNNAVAARKLGAAGYLVKPLDLHDLEKTLREFLSSESTRDSSKAEASSSSTLAGDEAGALVGGAGPEMQRAFVAIAHAAASDAPAIITGPTGTGKTLAARVIHGNSRRQGGPFVTLLCGALPEQLLESELFGHEKNAFTGAASMRPGHIERAAGGTLFLDEVSDIPVAVQAKLLRFVEEKTFNRIGGRQDISIDLRLITATNRSLRGEVQAGRFREDLYYRLHVLEIELPPLANRREDIPLLSAFLLSRLSADRELTLGLETSRLLANYAWPGNVRELSNALEYAATVCSGKVIQPHHLPKALSQPPHELENVDFDAALREWVAARVNAGATYKQLYTEVEGKLLKYLLQHFDQKPTVLARVLKMNRVTLLKKRRNFDLEQ